MIPLRYLATGLSVWLPLLVEPVSAQNWQMVGCGANENTVKTSWAQAMDIATRAANMLNTRLGEAPVRNAVDIILGTNADPTWAKFYYASVAQYNREPSQVTARNTDLWVLCDGSWLQPMQVQGGTALWNKYQGQWETADTQKLITDCHTRTDINSAGITLAVTGSSDLINQAGYDAAVQAWWQNPIPANSPALQQFSSPRSTLPNIMNICKAAFLQNVFGNTITKNSLERQVADTVAPGRQSAPADYLLKQLPVTLLHELTHTNLGGRSSDFPKGQCYGWDCVKYGKTSARNGDTIALLGVALWMIDEGFQLTSFGGVKKI